MSLLQMSTGRLPAADDVLPVLIYVVIMVSNMNEKAPTPQLITLHFALLQANPPYLLSTVEYINCFLSKKLEGEDEFYWTLFGSVVKFIKTMDYLD